MRKAYDTNIMAVKRTALGKRKRGARAPQMLSARLQAQVKQLMRMRQEKKYKEISATGNVGQVDGSATGALVSPITSLIGQGDGEGQRIGNSITATGLVFKQQFVKQLNGIGPRRVRTYIFRTLDPSINILTASFDVNPLSGVIDYFSSLSYTMMSDKRVQLLGRAETKLMFNYDDNMAQVNERSTGELTVPIKFDDQTIRYDSDVTSSPAAIRYFAVTMCDNGNISTSASTAPVFVPTASSGVESKAYARLWYTDS